MIEPYLALRASAGSGKTFALSVRYVSLLLLGAKPQNILCLTFTNKAASEMKQRIINVLSMLQNKEAELEYVIKLTGFSKEEILQKKETILNNFLLSNHKIMTIDSFLNSILKSFSLYASINPDFTIGKIHEYLHEVLFLKQIYHNNLWEELVFLSLLQNKNRKSLLKLFDFLYQKDIEIQKLSFKVHKQSAPISQKIMNEFQKLASILKQCPKYNQTLQNMLKADKVEDIAAKSWIDRESLKYKYSKFNNCYEPVMDDILQNIQALMHEYYTAKENEMLSSLFKLYDIYKSTNMTLKKQKNKIDFLDMTNIVANLLQTSDLEFLYFRLDGKIEHLLIDEFQDTSITQYQILKPIIEEIRAGIGAKDILRTFFYVGDTKQSIYRFRGGSSNLFSFVMQKHHIKSDFLNTNYRSSKAVVDFVNKTFEDKIEGYDKQKVKEKADDGYVEVDESEDIIQNIIQKVKTLKNSLNHTAILTFTNADVITIKEAILKEINIKITTDSSKKLISYDKVLAIIEFVKYLYFKEEIFLEEFYALAQIKRKKAHFDINQNFFFLIKEIIEFFEIFRNDVNVLKFLEICKEFRDIEDFIFNYELIDASQISSEDEGLKILTIHKSKGLEFENVIVVDRLKRENTLRDSLLFEYNEIKLTNIYYHFANREKFDKNFATALQKEKELEKKDLLNTLYVATTRAKTNLFIIKNSKKSAFDILNLQKQQNGTLKQHSISPSFPENKTFKKIELCNYGVQKITTKKEKDEKSMDFIAIEEGIALHYALEMIKEFKEKYIQDALSLVKNRFFLQDYEKIKILIKNIINNDNFQQLINGKIYKEKAFIFNNEIGVIDLLIVQDDKNIIIDYKTGQKQNKHIEQVQKYKSVIKEFFSSSSCEGYLCYVNSKNSELIKVD